MRKSTVAARRILAVAVAAGLFAVAGCTSDEDSGSSSAVPAATTGDGEGASPTDPPPTDPPSTLPPVTDPPPSTDPVPTDPAEPPATEPTATDPGPLDPDLSFLWIDVDQMVATWTATNDRFVAVEPGAFQEFPLAVDDLAIAALQSGGDGFANVGSWPTGFVSGTIDPGGEVSALVTTIDPLDENWPALFDTALATVTSPWSESIGGIETFVAAVAVAFAELGEARVPGEQRFVRGPDGTPYSAVLTTLEDGGSGDLAVEIAVIPLDEEPFALSVVELLRLELMVVTGG